MAIGFFAQKLTKFWADINHSDNQLARGEKLIKQPESLVISLLDEQQKITVAQLIQAKMLIQHTSNLDLVTLNSLVHGILACIIHEPKNKIKKNRNWHPDFSFVLIRE